MTTRRTEPFARQSDIAESIPLNELVHPVVRGGLEYWERLLRSQAVPARKDVNPRTLGPLLANVTLVAVLPEDDDFELRIAGDAIARAFRIPVHGQRLKAVAPAIPKIAGLLRLQYQEVVRACSPRGWRYATDASLDVVTFTGAEYLVLPLSDDGHRVDHILGFAGFVIQK